MMIQQSKNKQCLKTGNMVHHSGGKFHIKCYIIYIIKAQNAKTLYAPAWQSFWLLGFLYFFILSFKAYFSADDTLYKHKIIHPEINEIN